MQGVAKLVRGTGNVRLLEVPEPKVISGHMLVEVKAAGVCGTDLHIYHDEYPSLFEIAASKDAIKWKNHTELSTAIGSNTNSRMLIGPKPKAPVSTQELGISWSSPMLLP